MRTDIFQDRKGVHVKLDKSVHAALRGKLFNHNLSMQEVFEEFAKLLVTDDAKANRMIENLTIRKVKEAIEGKEPQRRRDRSISDLDHDTLYDLIEEGPHKHEDR